MASTKADLKPKEKLVVEYLLQNHSLTESVKLAGYGSYLQNRPSEVWDKPAVQREFRKALETGGIKDRVLVTVLAEGLQAKKQVVVGGTIQEYPDHRTRGDFLDRACKLLGLNPSEEVDHTIETYEQKLQRLRGL